MSADSIELRNFYLDNGLLGDLHRLVQTEEGISAFNHEQNREIAGCLVQLVSTFTRDKCASFKIDFLKWWYIIEQSLQKHLVNLANESEIYWGFYQLFVQVVNGENISSPEQLNTIQIIMKTSHFQALIEIGCAKHDHIINLPIVRFFAKIFQNHEVAQLYYQKYSLHIMNMGERIMQDNVQTMKIDFIKLLTEIANHCDSLNLDLAQILKDDSLFRRQRHIHQILQFVYVYQNKNYDLLTKQTRIDILQFLERVFCNVVMECESILLGVKILHEFKDKEKIKINSKIMQNLERFLDHPNKEIFDATHSLIRNLETIEFG